MCYFFVNLAPDVWFICVLAFYVTVVESSNKGRKCTQASDNKSLYMNLYSFIQNLANLSSLA